MQRRRCIHLQKITVFDGQHDKLKNAIAHQKPISVKLNIDHGGGVAVVWRWRWCVGGMGGWVGVWLLGGGGEHTLLLTRGWIAKIERTIEIDWKTQGRDPS